jgi:hypothetical protein
MILQRKRFCAGSCADVGLGARSLLVLCKEFRYLRYLTQDNKSLQVSGAIKFVVLLFSVRRSRGRKPHADKRGQALLD